MDVLWYRNFINLKKNNSKGRSTDVKKKKKKPKFSKKRESTR